MTTQALEAATDAAIAAEKKRMPGVVVNREAVRAMIAAAAPCLERPATDLRLNLTAPDDPCDETMNEIVQNAPECWGDDVSIDDIAVRYVRHLESEVARLGGTTCRPTLGEPHTHGPGGEMVFDPENELLSEDGDNGGN